LLCVDRKAIGIIEAKKVGTLLSGVAEQSAQYAESLPDFMEAVVSGRLPFVYESTGAQMFFTNYRDPDPRARDVSAFHRPETLRAWASEPSSLRTRLRQMPLLITNGMRQCPIEAIHNLEASFAENHPRALIQMATGAGKTFTAVSCIYRLIKHAGARRVLFLVDNSNLGRQTGRAPCNKVASSDRAVRFRPFLARARRPMDRAGRNELVSQLLILRSTIRISFLRRPFV
jgi:type I restriction enzyme, R subunit